MDLAIGDEQTIGYSPKALNNKVESKVFTKALGTKVISKGMKGASLTIKGKSSLLHQLNQFSLPAYDRIFLFYGMNDYLYSEAKLGAIGQALTKAINVIRHKNQWIKIYGILPLPMYDKSGKAYARQQGVAGYTLHDLLAMLGITYANNDVKSLNWMTLTNPVVNRNNYKQRLTDGKYPTEQTYQLMAERISEFVKQNPNSGSSMPTVNHPTMPAGFSEQTGSKNEGPVISFGKPLVKDKKSKKKNRSTHKKCDRKANKDKKPGKGRRKRRSKKTRDRKNK